MYRIGRKMYRLHCQVLIYRRIARVDIADQVKEILAGVQTKSMFRLGSFSYTCFFTPRHRSHI